MVLIMFIIEFDSNNYNFSIKIGIVKILETFHPYEFIVSKFRECYQLQEV